MAPHSKREQEFVRDRLEAAILRLFLKAYKKTRLGMQAMFSRLLSSAHNTVLAHVQVTDVKAAMPAYSDASIRKRLKQCAEYHRDEYVALPVLEIYCWVVLHLTHVCSSAWVWKRAALPEESDILDKVLPEDVCAWESMQAAVIRLEEMGYDVTSFQAEAVPEEDDGNDKVLPLTSCVNFHDLMIS